MRSNFVFCLCADGNCDFKGGATDMEIRTTGRWVLVILFMVVGMLVSFGDVKAADIRNIVQYEVREDGVYITDLKQDVETLKVPRRIDGKPVVSLRIGADWKVMKKLDVSQCKDLKKLRYTCYEMGSITKLDCSGLKKLKKLDISYSSICNLNVTGCTSLRILYADRAPLTKLDVSTCKKLESLIIWEGDFNGEILDLNRCKNLKVLQIVDSYISKIKIDQCEKLESLDIQHEDYLEELNLQNCTQLKEVILSDNRKHLDIEKLDFTHCKELSWATISKMKIKELSLKNCKKLQYLSVEDNNLKKLDIQGCNNLENITVTGNTLKKLDIPKCKVRSLDCRENCLEELTLADDMSELSWLFCEKNKLSSLHLKYYPKLTNVFCYENQLRELTIDSTLQYLNCSDNQLENIEMENKGELEALLCENNHLKGTLDLREYPRLKTLACSNNDIEKILFNTNQKTSESYYIRCSNNSLSELDLSMFTKVREINCSNNQISDLKLSVPLLSNMEYLYCSDNQLTKLDLNAENSKLTHLDCSNNQISDLKIDLCKMLKEVNVSNNPCVE